MDTDQTKYWVALSQVKRLGATRFRKLEKHFQDLPDFLEENPHYLLGLRVRVITPAVNAAAAGGR